MQPFSAKKYCLQTEVPIIVQGIQFLIELVFELHTMYQKTFSLQTLSGQLEKHSSFTIH